MADDLGLYWSLFQGEFPGKGDFSQLHYLDQASLINFCCLSSVSAATSDTRFNIHYCLQTEDIPLID